jgi:hypothetical protein
MKKHLIAGGIIGGLLLAATMHPAHTFALSGDAPATDSSTPSSTTTTTPTDSVDTSTATPTDQTTTPDPTNSSVAGGSTATQTTNNAVDSSSSSSASTTPSGTDPATSANNSSPAPQTDPSTSTDTQANTTTVNNTTNSNAQTGDASVSYNKVGGDATSGDASGIANLVNAIASSGNLSDGGLQTFTYNVNGTVNGNITINPNDILPANSPTTTSGSDPNHTTVDSQNNVTLNNNVDLSASTGDATVNNNGVGGNATSGNATTEADIINLIEALISDKQSFLGVININGTLNGNIQLPAGLIDSLLKQAQSGSGSTISGDVTETNNIAVNNNVSLAATTGDATVSGNGNGGDATSGNATTKLNIYNLVNSQIVGGNVLLVFVNVMGNWYGLLMNAPAGTTAAALGGGIKQDTSVPASQVVATNNETINNNVTLTSKTGNATVSDNRIGGNATSGNATAVADIVNILGSQINLSGWLGILIINVFGTWNGSLTVKQPVATPSHTSNGSTRHHNSVSSNAENTDPNGIGSGFAYAISYPQEGSGIITAAKVLGATTTHHDSNPMVANMPVVFDHSKTGSKGVLSDFMIAGIAAIAVATVGTARFFKLRRKKI